MGRRIGIDLGTTNSVIAVVDVGGPRILHNKEGEPMTPSIVSAKDGEVIVGTPAKRRLPVAPQDTIYSVKRIMGRAFTDKEVIKTMKEVSYKIVEPSRGTKDKAHVIMGGVEYSPIDISSMILAKLKRDAEYVLGEEVTHAVITVPAYFNEIQKFATREAGRMAGLTVMRILDEPTAAAIFYSIETSAGEPKTILVYDLGGGTFDISILTVAAGLISPMGLKGDMWLGGDDFDQVIINYVIEKIKTEKKIDPSKNMKFLAKLKQDAQKAKEELSASKSADIVIDYLKNDLGENLDCEIQITRDKFDELIDPVIKKTQEMITMSLDYVSLSDSDIDYVVMAGNSTLVPKVQNFIEARFGKDKVRRIIHPKQCVALGAAIAAGLAAGISCPVCNQLITDESIIVCTNCQTSLEAAAHNDITCHNCGKNIPAESSICPHCNKPLTVIPDSSVAPYNFGIQSEGDKFNIFIRKGDPYPTTGDKMVIQTFYTRFFNQRCVSIPVYGGESEDVASNNEKQGEAVAILPPNSPKDTPLRIKLWLNKDGIFDMTVHLSGGDEVPAFILRGEADQRAVELLINIEQKILNKGTSLDKEKKKAIEKSMDEMLKHISGKDYSKAEDNAGQIQKLIGDEQGSLASNNVAWINFIMSRYDWLIGQDINKFIEFKASFEEAIRRNDSNQLRQLSDRFNKFFNDLMVTIDPATNQSVPTELGTFFIIENMLNQLLQYDPVKGNKFSAEYDIILGAMRRNDVSVQTRAQVFMNDLLQESLKIPGEGIECPKCKVLNQRGTSLCGNCGTNLIIVRK